MTRSRFFENENFDTKLLDVSTWPTVLSDQLDEKSRPIFLKRKQAVELYLKNDKPVRDISALTGIKRNHIYQFAKRCMETDENGVIWGFRALIPNKRITSYQRKNLPKGKSSKLTGAFMLLLNTHPTIKDTIHDYYLNSRKQKGGINYKVLHKKFLDSCRTVGISSHDYPFNTETNAKKALQIYIKRLEKQHSNSRTETPPQPNHAPIIRPYQRVQFDGHRIDTALSVVFQTPEGDEIVETMHRIWILVIIDVATRTIIGHHLCLNKEYSSTDVLHCIRNAIVPWKPEPLTIPGLTYSDSGNFPSHALHAAQWGLWDEFFYDNARANLSNIVRDRLTQVVGCAVNAGPVRTPERRGIIERFFKTLEESSYHQLESTTGSHPRDPLGADAEKNAIKYRISAQHLEEVTQVILSNYNGTPHEGVNNLTPLEVLEQRLSRGMPIRTLSEEQRNEVVFFSMKAERKITGNRKTGRKPRIHFEGVTYHSEVLSRSPDLIGTKLTLLVNTDDVRSVRAYLPDGSEFGVLSASGKWGTSPHNLRTRKLINKLRNRKALHITMEDDPVEVLQRYLEAEAKNKKTARNSLSDLNRYVSQSTETNTEEENSKEKTTNELEAYRDQKKGSTKSSARKLTKTITY